MLDVHVTTWRRWETSDAISTLLDLAMATLEHRFAMLPAAEQEKRRRSMPEPGRPITPIGYAMRKVRRELGMARPRTKITNL